MEHRAAPELRTTGRTLYGIAAPFNQAAEIGGAFRETILPGAFRATLASSRDILALSDHRSDTLLGRTRSSTLRLHETPAGLNYQIDLPETSLGNDILSLAARGDLGGVSIGFTADDEAWPNARTRELRAVTLHEISVIQGGHAAYTDTTIALRHRVAMGDAARLRRLIVQAL